MGKSKGIFQTSKEMLMASRNPYRPRGTFELIHSQVREFYCELDGLLLRAIRRAGLQLPRGVEKSVMFEFFRDNKVDVKERVCPKSDAIIREIWIGEKRYCRFNVANGRKIENIEEF